ncbi:MAG: sigma-70 family RNA polymerase sigma factor [Fimbriimonadaceae bacterium]|nr:sigma-70 family RNA polymerase sigma factor [Fimbriimonadaceae bacterium]
MIGSFTRALQRSQTDRKQLFEQLMEESYRSAYNLAYRLAGNGHDAEDLLQESYVRAFRFFNRYDQSLPFTSWFFRIITNVHIDTVRRKKKLSFISLDAGKEDSDRSWELPDESVNADRQLMEETLSEPLQIALDAMNPDFRLAVLFADVEGMSYEEIADMMGTSVGTVRSRVHRGRKQLRKNIEKLPRSLRSEWRA